MNAPSIDMAALLADQGISLVMGTNLFISEMPPSPDLCLAVFDTGGKDPAIAYEYERPSVQVRVRGAKGAYSAAYTKAQECRDALSGLHNEETGGARYIVIMAKGDIIFLGYDENHRPQFSINFECHRSTA